MPTHLIGHFSKGGTRTLCGLPLVTGEIARNGQPECPDCQRIDEQDAKSLLALQQENYDKPLPPVERFSSTAAYKTSRGRS